MIFQSLLLQGIWLCSVFGAFFNGAARSHAIQMQPLPVMPGKPFTYSPPELDSLDYLLKLKSMAPLYDSEAMPTKDYERYLYGIYVEDYTKSVTVVENATEFFPKFLGDLAPAEAEDWNSVLSVNGLLSVDGDIRVLEQLENFYRNTIHDETLNALQLMFLSIYPMKLRNSKYYKKFGMFNLRGDKEATLDYLLKIKKFAENYDTFIERTNEICQRSKGATDCSSGIDYNTFVGPFMDICYHDHQCKPFIVKLYGKVNNETMFYLLGAYIKQHKLDENSKYSNELFFRPMVDLAAGKANFERLACKRMEACKRKLNYCETKLIDESSSKYSSNVYCSTSAFFDTERIISKFVPQDSFINVAGIEKYILYTHFGESHRFSGKNISGFESFMDQINWVPMGFDEVSELLLDYFNTPSHLNHKVENIRAESFKALVGNKLMEMVTKIKTDKRQFYSEWNDGIKRFNNDYYAKFLLSQMGKIMTKQVQAKQSFFIKYFGWFTQLFSGLFSKQEMKVNEISKEYNILLMDMAYEGKVVDPKRRVNLLKRLAEVTGGSMVPLYEDAIKQIISKSFSKYKDEWKFLASLYSKVSF